MIKVNQATWEQGQVPPEWGLSDLERRILEKMAASGKTYAFDTQQQLRFELTLRQETTIAARALGQSGVSFSTFKNARCNPQYWELTSNGGFLLKKGVSPASAIEDIYLSGHKYGFECATAIVIILYKAVLQSIDRNAFNRLFGGLFLHSWQFDQDLGLKTVRPVDYFAGDARYFENPDFDLNTPQWQGENVIDLGDGTYFGHGVGVRTADEFIATLNKFRKPGAMRSAFLLDQATRPDYAYLSQFASAQRAQTDERPPAGLPFSEQIAAAPFRIISYRLGSSCGRYIYITQSR